MGHKRLARRSRDAGGIFVNVGAGRGAACRGDATIGGAPPLPPGGDSSTPTLVADGPDVAPLDIDVQAYTGDVYVNPGDGAVVTTNAPVWNPDGSTFSPAAEHADFTTLGERRTGETCSTCGPNQGPGSITDFGWDEQLTQHNAAGSTDYIDAFGSFGAMNTTASWKGYWEVRSNRSGETHSDSILDQGVHVPNPATGKPGSRCLRLKAYPGNAQDGDGTYNRYQDNWTYEPGDWAGSGVTALDGYVTAQGGIPWVKGEPADAQTGAHHMASYGETHMLGFAVRFPSGSKGYHFDQTTDFRITLGGMRGRGTTVNDSGKAGFLYGTRQQKFYFDYYEFQGDSDSLLQTHRVDVLDVEYDQWYLFVAEVKLTNATDGYLKVWGSIGVEGQWNQLIDFTGRTCSKSASYPSTGVYFASELYLFVYDYTKLATRPWTGAPNTQISYLMGEWRRLKKPGSGNGPGTTGFLAVDPKTDRWAT